MTNELNRIETYAIAFMELKRILKAVGNASESLLDVYDDMSTNYDDIGIFGNYTDARNQLVNDLSSSLCEYKDVCDALTRVIDKIRY